MTTETVVTMETLGTKRTELMATIGQAAIDNDAKKLDAAVAERRKVDKQISDFAANAEKGARDAAAPLVAETLKSIDMKMSGLVMPNVVLSGTLRRGDSGKFDDLKIGVGLVGEVDLSALIYSAINTGPIEELESVKGIGKLSVGSLPVIVWHTLSEFHGPCP